MKKIKHLLRLIIIYFSYIFKKERVKYLPIRLWVETSSRCNLKCRLCVNKDMEADSKGEMDFNLYKKIIDEARDYIFDINLFHRGEPLMHPRIVEMVEYANKNKIKTRLHTNATMLTPKLSKELIMAGLNLISFSFDGYTPATYEKNRIGASYENTLSNIINFLKIKKELNSRTPFTQVQIMEFDDELSQKDFQLQKQDFFKNFEGLPIDKFVIRTPHNWGGLLTIEGIGKIDKQKSKFMACTFPWYALTIFFDGKVCLCPQDFTGNIQIGDIRKESIKKIFNDEAIRYIRRSFKYKKINNIEPCNECDRCWRKTILGIPKEYLGMFLKDSFKNN